MRSATLPAQSLAGILSPASVATRYRVRLFNPFTEAFEVLSDRHEAHAKAVAKALTIKAVLEYGDVVKLTNRDKAQFEVELY